MANVSRRTAIASIATIPIVSASAYSDDSKDANAGSYCFDYKPEVSLTALTFSGTTDAQGTWSKEVQFFIRDRIPYAVSPIVTEDIDGVDGFFDQGLGHALFVITKQSWTVKEWSVQNKKRYSVNVLKMTIHAKHWFAGGDRDAAYDNDNLHFGDTAKLPNFRGKLKFKGLIHALT